MNKEQTRVYADRVFEAYLGVLRGTMSQHERDLRIQAAGGAPKQDEN